MNKTLFRPFVTEVLRNYDIAHAVVGADVMYTKFVKENNTLKYTVNETLWFLPEKTRNEIYVEINLTLL